MPTTTGIDTSTTSIKQLEQCQKMFSVLTHIRLDLDIVCDQVLVSQTTPTMDDLFRKSVMLYSPALRTCWRPPKVSGPKKKKEKQRVFTENLTNQLTVLHPLDYFLYTKNKSIQCHSTHFLNGIKPILKTSTVSFFPHCPSNTCWDYSPPLLLTFSFPYSNPTTQKISSMFRIVHLIPVKLMNKDQICEVTLQCRKRWLLVSSASLHRKHLDTIWNPFFFKASWVRQAFLAANQEKHLTLEGATLFQICSQGPVSHPDCSLTLSLWILFTEKIPSVAFSIWSCQDLDLCLWSCWFFTRLVPTCSLTNHADTFWRWSTILEWAN